MNSRAALQQYKAVNRESEVEGADSHRLVQLLLAGALTRIAEAKGQYQRGDSAGFGESLGKTIGIITGLQSALDLEKGGEIAENLDGLYDYMIRTLLKVHSEKSTQPLTEVASLLTEIKSAWDTIDYELLADVV
ncbi:MAG: flagellar export chaperone FliS [Pseudomonadales bacterium]